MILHIGLTRSGKTALALQQCRDKKRLAVWEQHCRDWPGANCARIVDDFAAYQDQLIDHATGPLRICFGTSDHKNVRAHFDRWAQGSFIWGQYEPAWIVVEELAMVTGQGKGAGSWHGLVCAGLGFGISVMALAQRASEIDKSIFSNAGIVRVFAQDKGIDQKYIERELDIPAAEVAKLKPLEYLEKKAGTQGFTRHKVKFPSKA